MHLSATSALLLVLACSLATVSAAPAPAITKIEGLSPFNVVRGNAETASAMSPFSRVCDDGSTVLQDEECPEAQFLDFGGIDPLTGLPAESSKSSKKSKKSSKGSKKSKK
jgi:hypothetical protein